MFEAFFVALSSVWADSGFSALTGGHVIMIAVGLVLLYLAIAKGFEPLLLSPIAFGCILANIPKNGFEEPGVMSVIMYGIHHEVFPPLIFLGVGAMTDFGPLLANPKTLLLGAAAQAGVFVALLGAMLLGFTVQEAAAIGIIGGADGPTSIYLAAKMAPQLLGAIAVAAYSYMSLVPLIKQDDVVYTVRADEGARAAEAADLAKLVGSNAVAEADLATAYDAAIRGAGTDGVVCVCGSLYLVGEFKKMLLADKSRMN